jgi:hypothetical protein
MFKTKEPWLLCLKHKSWLFYSREDGRSNFSKIILPLVEGKLLFVCSGKFSSHPNRMCRFGRVNIFRVYSDFRSFCSLMLLGKSAGHSAKLFSAQVGCYLQEHKSHITFPRVSVVCAEFVVLDFRFIFLLTLRERFNQMTALLKFWAVTSVCGVLQSRFTAIVVLKQKICLFSENCRINSLKTRV